MAVVAPRKSPKRRRYELHTWLGFHLAIIMSVVLLTGTIATLSNEIDWLLQEDMRVSPDGEMVSWNAMERALRQEAPEHMLVTLSEMQGDHFAYRARMVRSDGKYYFMHVNQWTGEVTGTTHPLTVQRFFRDLHRYLFMPNFLGLPIVSAMAFVLGLSLYTGLRTAGKLRKTAVRLRTDKGTRIFVGDFHKSAGIWASWFFIVMVITGVWYFFEFGAAVAGKRLTPDRPSVPIENISSYGDVMQTLPAGDLVTIASAQIPNWRATDIQFSRRPGDPATVQGKTRNPFVRKRANSVYIDPVSGTVLKTQRAGEIGWLAYLNEMADPLHFGFFGNLPTKIIWFVFGVAMTCLSFTGVWLTCRRLKATMISRTQIATLPVMLAAMVFGKLYLDRYFKTEEPGKPLAMAKANEDEFIINTIWERGLKTGTPRIKVSVFHPDGRPMVKSVSVRSPSGQTHELQYKIFGNHVALAGYTPSLNEATRAKVVIRLASGRHIEQSLSHNEADADAHKPPASTENAP